VRGLIELGMGKKWLSNWNNKYKRIYLIIVCWGNQERKRGKGEERKKRNKKQGRLPSGLKCGLCSTEEICICMHCIASKVMFATFCRW
jgi:hypothetical protein